MRQGNPYSSLQKLLSPVGGGGLQPAKGWPSATAPSEVPAVGVVEAEELDWAGQPASARVLLPPLATVWLAPG